MQRRRSLANALAISALSIAITAAACSSTAPRFDAAAVAKQWVDYMQRDYVLRPRDRLAISVYQVPDLTQEVVVAPDGTVYLTRIVEGQRAAGKSIAAFRNEVGDLYSKLLRVGPADITVTLVEAGINSVYVAGEVNNPGVVVFTPGMTLSQAVSAAGSLKITANSRDVRIIRPRLQGRIETHRVNLYDTFYADGDDFLVLPGDVILCATSAIADAGNWVELYIRRLLPFSLVAPAFNTR
jgi:polysaccharide export outer membrane protein